MPGDHPDGAGDPHVQARDRLKAASTEQSRLRDEFEHARGTSSELQADTSLRAAGDELAARERWLQWVEERDYQRAV